MADPELGAIRYEVTDNPTADGVGFVALSAEIDVEALSRLPMQDVVAILYQDTGAQVEEKLDPYAETARQIFVEYGDFLLRAASFYFGGQDADIESLAQETIIKAAYSYEPASIETMQAMLVRILKNAGRDEWRKQQTTISRSGQRVPRYIHFSDISEPSLERYLAQPDALAESPQIADLWSALSGGLSSRQKEVMYWYYFEGMTEAETAAVIGISEGAVKSHKSRAIGALKERMGEKHPD